MDMYWHLYIFSGEEDCLFEQDKIDRQYFVGLSFVK